MDISLSNVDPAWFFGGLIGLNAVGFTWLKKDTRQVNKAVNHVPEGTATLSERMDVANQTIEFIQATQIIDKKETAERFEGVDKKQNEIRGIIEEVKTTQNQVVESVDKIRESVDRRYKGGENE